QQPFRPGRRYFSAHDVMRGGRRCDEKERSGKESSAAKAVKAHGGSPMRLSTIVRGTSTASRTVGYARVLRSARNEGRARHCLAPTSKRANCPCRGDAFASPWCCRADVERGRGSASPLRITALLRSLVT